ncbi:MAG: protein-(glutamine-N5) methyltransferase, release factor-specific, partial [Gammaproteobacteria bacterium]|nr:protein-(glutamine-N5) methyltransferase, release factor-specific [Gammaproteobacteria bacterium]
MSERIDEALRWGADRISACSETARLDAELLLAHCLGKPRSYLYGRPEQKLSQSCWQNYQQQVQKRL